MTAVGELVGLQLEGEMVVGREVVGTSVGEKVGEREGFSVLG